MSGKRKLIRVTTVPESLCILLKGQHRFMNEYYEVTGVSSEGAMLREVGNSEGIRVIPVPMERTISLWKDLKSVYTLYRLFRKEKPFIVHTHTPKAGMAGMLAAKFARVPVRLHTVAGLPLMEQYGFKRKVLDFVEKVTYMCATRIYPNSSGLRDFIVENRFCSPEKVKVLGAGSSNGIDTSHFDPALYDEGKSKLLKKELGIPEGAFVFIFVGRLVKEKGIGELTEAFTRVNARYPGTRLLLVGGFEKERDPLDASTEEEIVSNPDILHAGFQKDVRPFFSVADCLVFPSYREGFPNVVMQACSMELPVIVTDINGCNEIVSCGENGFIIPPKDIRALTDAMQKVYEEPGELQQMGKRAREMMKESYERGYVWDCLLKEYQSFEKSV